MMRLGYFDAQRIFDMFRVLLQQCLHVPGKH